MANLADLLKDLEKKTADAKTRAAGGIAFLNDPKKVADAGLYDKKKMNGFVSNIVVALSRAKETRDTILQSKDYKAITDAKNAIKVKFTALNNVLNKEVQVQFAKLREAATKVDAAHDPRRVALEAQKKALAPFANAKAAYANKAIWKQVAEFAKTEHSLENFAFIAALDSGKLDVAYKMLDAVNVGGGDVAAIKAKPKDAKSYAGARKAVMTNIDDTVSRWRTQQIAKVDAALKKLGG